MDIQTQIATAKILYAKDLVASIFPDGSWMTRSRNDTQYVKGKKVERSNVSGKPKVRRDKQNLKIDAKRRTLVADDYNIHEFSTDPEALVFTEESLSNPQMRANALAEHQNSLNEDIGHFLKSQWGTSEAGSQVRTTGAARAAAAKGATGTRNTITYHDFLEAYQIFLNWDLMPDSLLIPASMYVDMLKIEEFINNDHNAGGVIPTGKIGSILGMEVFSVSTGIHHDNSAVPQVQQLVPKDDGSAGGTTFAGGADNNLGLLMWDSKMVTRAKGTGKVFITPDDAETQATLMSTNCVAGGSKYRKDEKGIVSIVEGFIAA